MKTTGKHFAIIQVAVAVATIFAGIRAYSQDTVTVIDFEEFATSPDFTPFPFNFHGVTFSSDFGVWSDQLETPPHSGTTRALANRLGNGDKECTFAFTIPNQRFLGAWFNVTTDHSVQMVLYNDGLEVARSRVLSMNYESTFLASGYDGPVDSVGVLGFRGFYALDDLTFTSVPEPSTWILLATGVIILRALRALPIKVRPFVKLEPKKAATTAAHWLS